MILRYFGRGEEGGGCSPSWPGTSWGRSWVRALSHDVMGLRIRARLHQASASTKSQRCNDACNIALIEISGVTPKCVATPFWSDTIFFIDFNESYVASVIAALTLRWRLTLGVNGP